MFVDFFLALKRAGVPVSLTEFLTLLEALKQHACGPLVEEFYYLSRATLVKDERNLDKFDRVFGETFKGVALRYLGARAPLADSCRRYLHHRRQLYLGQTPSRQNLAQPIILKTLYSSFAHGAVPSLSCCLRMFFFSFGIARSSCLCEALSYLFRKSSKDSLNSHSRMCRSGTAIWIDIGVSGWTLRFPEKQPTKNATASDAA